MAKKASKPVPAGMNTLTAQLWFNGNAGKAFEFYQKALGAEPVGPPVLGPDGKAVMHAMLKIGNSSVMMADAWPNTAEAGPKGVATAGLWVYVKDCDALYQRALAAGCEVIMAMDDMFWGDRMGKLKDPFGHCWCIAAHKWDFTPEEMQQRTQDFMSQMQQQ
ncbi:MAG: VOC family protein [Candidatus Lambdaproteobacteria bacterium]|nr:VOC family protein [Candidatus Lambdaproteobacteria bacterium]